MNEKYLQSLLEKTNYKDIHFSIKECEELESLVNTMLYDTNVISDIPEFLERLEGFKDIDIHEVLAFWNYLDADIELFNLENFQESYVGQFNSLSDFEYYITSELSSIPSMLENYINYDKFADDLITSGDYSVVDGKYYFKIF